MGDVCCFFVMESNIYGIIDWMNMDVIWEEMKGEKAILILREEIARVLSVNAVTSEES